MWVLSGRIGRDDRLDAAPFEFFAQAVSAMEVVGADADILRAT
jgi:hypothetical protein